MGRLLFAAALLAASGCSGLVDNEGLEGLTPEQITAQRLWVSKALPRLQTSCISCHDGSMPDSGNGPAPGFLEGTGDLTKRDTLFAYTPSAAAGVASILDLGAPSLSLLLIKGSHDGPELDAAQKSDILEWLNAEKAAAPDEDPGNRIETTPFLAQMCISGLPDDPAAPNPNCPVNKISLDAIGATGSEIRFVVQSLGATGIYIQGGVTDTLQEAGKLEDLREACALLRQLRVVSGLAGHQPKTHRDVQALALPAIRLAALVPSTTGVTP